MKKFEDDSGDGVKNHFFWNRWSYTIKNIINMIECRKIKYRKAKYEK